MKTNKLISSLAVLAIGFTMFVPGVFAKAFGISPPSIVNENIKPGASFVYVIDLSTNDPSEEMIVESQVTGDPEIAQWLSVRNSGSLTMPRGEKHAPMYVDVKVPQNAKLGKYKGSIQVRVVPKKTNNKGSVAILLGGNISVDLNVINYDVTDYWVRGVNVEPILEGHPIELSIKLKNLGNTNISEVPVNVEVTDYRTGDVVARTSASQLSEHIYPHTVKEVTMQTSKVDLPEGNYWANVTVFKNGREEFKNKLYLTVDGQDLNSSLETSVDVASKDRVAAIKKAAEAQALRAAALTPTKSNISVQTTVTVRAPLTNQLIGVVIALLGIIIIVTSKIFTVLKRRRR